MFRLFRRRTGREQAEADKEDGEQGGGHEVDADVDDSLPSMLKMATIVVTRPIGAETGDEIEVETGDGRSFSVAIPQGVAPGEEFEIEFEDTDASLHEAEHEKEQVDAFDDELADLLGSSDGGDSEEANSQDVEKAKEPEERQESPRAVREREAEELQRRLASLEVDAGLPTTALALANEEAEDPFSALAALLPE